jgi:hypothetical protein
MRKRVVKQRDCGSAFYGYHGYLPHSAPAVLAQTSSDRRGAIRPPILSPATTLRPSASLRAAPAEVSRGPWRIPAPYGDGAWGVRDVRPPRAAWIHAKLIYNEEPPPGPNTRWRRFEVYNFLVAAHRYRPPVQR